MQKVTLTCDVCKKEVKQSKAATKDFPQGEPTKIGRITGVIFDKEYKMIELDLCEEHWDKVVELTANLTNLNKA